MAQAIPQSPEVIPRLKFNRAQYHAIVQLDIFGDRRLELLNGDITVVTMPDPIHEWLIRQLVKYFQNVLGELAIVDKAYPIALNDDNEPLPDIVILRNVEHEYKSQHPTPNDVYLLIEIANSHPERDLTGKRPIYAQAGIQEYWVFDLQKQELRVFRDIEDGDYQIDVVWEQDNITIQVSEEVLLNAKEMKQIAFEE